MKRLAIFASYDVENIVDDYVSYYLSELSKVADIIYVSDCDMKEKELLKIKDYVIHIINGRHGEYDFGSYKRGFLYAKDNNLLENYDYLILCNDSNFGPFFSLENILDTFDKKNDKAFGIFKHLPIDNFGRNSLKLKALNEHLQSHFLYLHKDIFLSDWYEDFIYSIKKEKDKKDIIVKYEVGMSALILDKGYSLHSLYEDDTNAPYYAPSKLIKKGYPFLKKDRKDLLLSEIYDILKGIEDSYNISLIDNYYKRKYYKHFYCKGAILESVKEYLFILRILQFTIFGIKKYEEYFMLIILGIKITLK